MNADKIFNQLDVTGLVNDIISDIVRKQDKELEKIVREYATPKISGEITKGKLRWRGLRLIQKTGIAKDSYWIEQRGKIIGYKIITEYKFNTL
jgi:hypothetical protein